MTDMPHLLVVDDDREIRDLLSQFLGKSGFRVTTASGGKEMKKALADWKIDLVVLDLMMPGEDGLTLARDIRAGSNKPQSRLPIIMLTAMGEETDRIVGLEMGADDYLAKPFNPRELLARIKAVLRRAEPTGGDLEAAEALTFVSWKLVPQTRELFDPDGVGVELSTGEYDLLLAFLTHPGRVLSRDQLLDFARGRDAQPFDRAIDVQVSRLRRKIEPDPTNPTLIKTVRGGGYMFTPKVECG